MALDAWLFQQHLAGTHPPTLRFYTWEPVAISLGYHQRQMPEHWHTLTWQDQPIDIVVRPTGGRAVLHQGDLTYAVVMSGVPNSRQAAYQSICEFLIQGWRSLGISLRYGQTARGYIHNPNCFGTATAADLILPDGCKLIGSAQLRQGSTVLQHGSMPLTPNPDLFHTIFNTDPHPLRLPVQLTTATLVAALTQAAQTCFNANFQIQPLTQQEWEEVGERGKRGKGKGRIGKRK